MTMGDGTMRAERSTAWSCILSSAAAVMLAACLGAPETERERGALECAGGWEEGQCLGWARACPDGTFVEEYDSCPAEESVGLGAGGESFAASAESSDFAAICSRPDGSSPPTHCAAGSCDTAKEACGGKVKGCATGTGEDASACLCECDVARAD